MVKGKYLMEGKETEGSRLTNLPAFAFTATYSRFKVVVHESPSCHLVTKSNTRHRSLF